MTAILKKGYKKSVLILYSSGTTLPKADSPGIFCGERDCFKLDGPLFAQSFKPFNFRSNFVKHFFISNFFFVPYFT